MAPWRILEQTLAMKTQDGEPGLTLQFTIDPANSAQCRLRIVSPEEGADAYEVVFATGGAVLEQVYQPRVLKPFHRGPIVVPPEPVEVAGPKEGEKLLVNPLTNRPETDAEREKREALQELKDKREGLAEDRAKADHEEAEALAKLGKPFKMRTRAELDAGLGPDSTAPNSPDAERARAAQAGIDNTEPSDADRKGMVTQPPGGQAGETAKLAASQQPNAPNAVDQQLQSQGKAKTLEQLQAEDVAAQSKVVDTASMKAQEKPVT